MLFRISLLVICCAHIAAVSPKPRGPEIRVADLERRVHELINRERRERKLEALVLDERLSSVARAHSQDMATRGFFDHRNPDGQDPADRGRRAGVACAFGENLYQSNLYSRIRIKGDERTYDWNSAEEIAHETVEGWMRSPGHRQNILRKDYRRAGLGVAIAADDRVYLTELFCSPS